MFDWLIQLLNHPALPWIAADLLPIWAMAAWWFTRDAWLDPLRQEIHTARQLCDETPDSPESFAPHFRRLHAGMEHLPRLGAAWQNFVVTLIDHDAPNTSILRTAHPNTHFELAALSKSNPHAERLRILPLHLIGAGVLFTFIGLLGALQVAATGLVPGDAASAQQAVRAMLGLAAFKFLASISGLFTAWIVSWRTRAWHERLEKELGHLCEQLVQRFPSVTREQLLHAQLRAMQQLGQENAHRPLSAKSEGARHPSTSLSLEPVIATLREENDKLRDLIRARLPESPHAPPAVPQISLSLEPVVTTLREENDKLRDLIRARLPDPSTSSPMLTAPEESLPVQGTATTLIAPDPNAWRPLIESLREEGRHVVRELALHLAREIQPLLVRSVESSAMVSRGEQESWMRIVDRMEMAARALERQSEGLEGLSELARETRQASEGATRANRETVEALVSAVEGFNERMSSSFARSAEALLERLARNNQQIVAQVIEEFDGDRARQVVESVGRESGVSELYHQFLSRRRRNPR
ncbi:MAG: hypothetical protein HQL86_00035 [Magnetococcales bacterium]|nr:hypothetical protein [Magnetococcales bacterium]